MKKRVPKLTENELTEETKLLEEVELMVWREHQIWGEIRAMLDGERDQLVKVKTMLLIVQNEIRKMLDRASEEINLSNQTVDDVAKDDINLIGL